MKTRNPARGGVSRDAALGMAANSDADYTAIEAALSYIPANNRDTWLRMGMAIKCELGEGGFSLWNEWSRTADNYKAGDARDVWRSIKPDGGVTIGSLLHEAKANGYRGDGGDRNHQEDGAARARAIWEDAPSAPDDHPYLFRKGIRSYGLRLYRGPLKIAGMNCDGALLVPINNGNGKLQSLEFISQEEIPNNKRFLPRGKKAGNLFLIGDPGNVILVSEGYADAASLYESTSYASAVAFDAGNISSVVETVRSQYPNARILACVDNDDAGAKAGRSLSGVDRVGILPPPKGFKDFNEFHRRSGIETVESYLKGNVAGEGPKGAETGHAAETILDIGKAVLSFEDLLKTEIPERKRLLPWLPEGGLSMVYSPRGLGKTFFGLSLAHALTSGTPFMKWQDVSCVGVLYIDGEMPLGETRERLQGFIFENPKAPLEVLSHERFYQQFEKDLIVTDPDVQHALLTLLDAKKELRVVILDNLSSASRLREDKADDWRNHFLPFLIACRRRGVAVVLIHHTGKGGDQRGTGAREDHLDTSIKLSKPDDHTSEGCHFRVDFTKARSCYGEMVEPFTAQLIKGSDGAYTWAIATIEESTKERLIEIIADCGEKGISVSEAASELDVAHSLVSKLKRELVDAGVIQDLQVRKAKMIIAANWEGKK
jgi:putative DNA primase/helicase